MRWRLRIALVASPAIKSLRSLSSSPLDSPPGPERNFAACRLPSLQRNSAKMRAHRLEGLPPAAVKQSAVNFLDDPTVIVLQLIADQRPSVDLLDPQHVGDQHVRRAAAPAL